MNPETFHWFSQLHETSKSHLLLATTGKEFSVNNFTKKPQVKGTTMCVIRNKGFMKKTLNNCKGFISNPSRIAEFMSLTKDWHIQ